jgi:hypothetical protein
VSDTRDTLQWLRSIVLLACMVASTVAYACLVIACCWMPYERRYELVRSWARLQFAATRVLCGLDYVVEGREQIPPGCHISMWRHSSAWEVRDPVDPVRRLGDLADASDRDQPFGAQRRGRAGGRAGH